MTLDEVRVLLRFKDDPQAECGAVNELLDEHIGHVATRIRELRQLEKHLRALRTQCASVRTVEQCGILTGITQSGLPTSAQSTHAHVAGAHGGRRVKVGIRT